MRIVRATMGKMTQSGLLVLLVLVVGPWGEAFGPLPITGATKLYPPIALVKPGLQAATTVVERKTTQQQHDIVTSQKEEERREYHQQQDEGTFWATSSPSSYRSGREGEESSYTGQAPSSYVNAPGDGSTALYGGLFMLEDDAEEESEVRDVLSSGSIIRPLPRQQPHQPATSMPRQQWYAVEAEYEALQQEASSAAAAIPMPRQHSIFGEIGRKFWGVTRRRAAAFFQGYSKLLETKYYMMSFIQATALGVLGDLIAQGVETLAFHHLPLKALRFNMQRTANVAILAAIIDGIASPRYYDLMDAISDKTTFRVVALKVLIGTLIYGPIANGAFLAAVPVMEKGLKAGFDFALWKRQLHHITIRDIQMWALFYPVNFTLVPRHFRPLANSIMGLAFMVILSFCAYGV